MTVEGLTGGYWPSQDVVPCLKMPKEMGLHGGPDELSAATVSMLERPHELKRLIRDGNSHHDLSIGTGVSQQFRKTALLHRHFKAVHNLPSDPYRAACCDRISDCTGVMSGSPTLHSVTRNLAPSGIRRRRARRHMEKGGFIFV